MGNGFRGWEELVIEGTNMCRFFLGNLNVKKSNYRFNSKLFILN